MNQSHTFTCQCGFSWVTGQSGSHSCDEGYRKQNKELESQRDALSVENIALRAAIEFATAPDMWIERDSNIFEYRYSEWYVGVLKAALETPVTETASASGAEVKKQRVILPDGWKLVPIEPTEDMVISGFESKPSQLFSPAIEWEAYEAMSGCQQAAHRAKLCWAAMLAATPTPDTDGGQQ